MRQAFMEDIMIKCLAYCIYLSTTCDCFLMLALTYGIGLIHFCVLHVRILCIIQSSFPFITLLFTIVTDIPIFGIRTQ